MNIADHHNVEGPSIGLGIASQIAAGEAALTQHEFVEPEHLFIGICKLGYFTRDEDLRDLELEKDETASLKLEGEADNWLFDKFHLDRVVLYREMRLRKGKANFPHKKGASVSRSPPSKAVFERAAVLAAAAPSLTSLH